MNHNYADIRSRIPTPPLWFDENAVPRYSDFAPRELSNIYADEGALVEIACQSCQMRFKVAFSRSTMDDIRARMAGFEPKPLADLIKENTIHYGDPPNVGCCPAGPTMNSDPLHVLEYWQRGDDFEWRRDPALEVDVSDMTTLTPQDKQREPST